MQRCSVVYGRQRLCSGAHIYLLSRIWQTPMQPRRIFFLIYFIALNVLQMLYPRIHINERCIYFIACSEATILDPPRSTLVRAKNMFYLCVRRLEEEKWHLLASIIRFQSQFHQANESSAISCSCGIFVKRPCIDSCDNNCFSSSVSSWRGSVVIHHAVCHLI